MGGPGFAPVNAASLAQAQGKVAPQPAIPAWASTGMNQPAPAPVAPPRPAVGTIYGVAGNGGLMTQGFGGINNSITQKNFAAAQGQQINPNGTMSLMAGGRPSHFNGVATGGSAYDKNPAAGGGYDGPQSQAVMDAAAKWHLANPGRAPAVLPPANLRAEATLPPPAGMQAPLVPMGGIALDGSLLNRVKPGR